MRHTKSLLALTVFVLAAGCASQNGRMPGPGGPNDYPSEPPPQTRPDDNGRQPSAPVDNTRPNNMSTPSAQTPAPKPSKTPPRDASEVSSPAVMSLLGRADTLAEAGHMDPAASTLERALDLDPRNPFIYQRLAAVRLAQGQTGQAEQMAMKSNSVSNNNPFVESSNWQLIAEARRSAGNDQGASQARARAVNYRQATSQYQR